MLTCSDLIADTQRRSLPFSAGNTTHFQCHSLDKGEVGEVGVGVGMVQPVLEVVEEVDPPEVGTVEVAPGREVDSQGEVVEVEAEVGGTQVLHARQQPGAGQQHKVRGASRQ
jgi:hypothetical protein